MKFGHLAIRVKNIDQILEFYCHQLGLKEAFRIYNDDGSLRIVYLHISEGQYFEICLGGDTRPGFNDTTSLGVRHICLTVENLEAFKLDAESRGAKFDSEIMLMRDKNFAAFLFDPEGNKIEIVQLLPNSPHVQFESKLGR